MYDESETCHFQLVQGIVLKHTAAIHKTIRLLVVIPMRAVVSGIRRGKGK
jgi:hypothetical protein